MDRRRRRRRGGAQLRAVDLAGKLSAITAAPEKLDETRVAKHLQLLPHLFADVRIARVKQSQARLERIHVRDFEPDEAYDIIEACCPGPYLELFARGARKGWTAWGNQADAYAPTWKTYANHSAAGRKKIATLFDL